MTNAAILEKLEQLPPHVQEEVTDFVEFLHQKYVVNMEEEETEYTPDGDAIIGYDIDGNPLLASVAREEFRRRTQSVDEGNYITVEQLRQAAKMW